jgi:rod shape determining protein RodA
VLGVLGCFVSGQSGRVRYGMNFFGMLVLCVLGILMIRSAESYAEGVHWKAQVMWVVLGVGAYSAVSFLDYRFYLYSAHIFYAIGMICLLLLWTPLGKTGFGALRWLQLGKITFQPSDVAKVGILFLVASLLARFPEVKTVRQAMPVLVKVACAGLFPFILIFLQPDLGSALVILPLIFALLYVSCLPSRFFLVVFSIGGLILVLVAMDMVGYYHFLTKNPQARVNHRIYEKQSFLPLRNYQRNRILGFIAPKVVDPRETNMSWNRKQSLISIGSGGLFGKGYQRGTQARLGYLPQAVAPNDFIFSVLAEEFGFLGGSFVLFLYGLLLWNTLHVASVAKDRFGRYLAVGVATIFLVHIFVNIGMTLGLMPIKGLPLPFLSYGGSFILICFILQGVVQSVYLHRNQSTLGTRCRYGE